MVSDQLSYADMTTSSDNLLKILIVDDDEVDRMAVRRALKGTTLNVSLTEAANAEEAIDIIAGAEHDCIFLDYNLPGKSGLALTRQIRHQEIRVPLIVLTGQGDEQTAVELMKAGASDYLPKSKLSSETIARLVRSSLKVHQAEARIEEINRNLREKNRLLETKNRELARQRRHIYKQNLQLQEVSRLKSEFLATMSHELRTPLNAIIGFSQILLSRAKGPLGERQQDMLRRILSNGRNLLELINDILAFSKIEAGRLEIEPTKLNLSELVTQTTGELRSLASQKSLQLIVNVDLSNPIVINDSVRLRQILVNLLSNAIKFTDTGSVYVEVSDQPPSAHAQVPDRTSGQSCDSTPSRNDIRMVITDTGCGISAEQQAFIFDPFHQADQRVSRTHAGTGLGLAITYSLIKMMNGDIEMHSEVDEGSVFSVTLPREIRPDREDDFHHSEQTSDLTLPADLAPQSIEDMDEYCE